MPLRLRYSIFRVPLAVHKTDRGKKGNEVQHGLAQSKQRITLRQRLGSLSLTILFLGSVILPLVMLLLGLVWRESMVAAAGNKARVPWIRIFSNNWSTTLVTVCSALIRTVVAFQASLATAMLAAIILESIGIPLLQAPFCSIVRALEVGPTSLLFTVRFRLNGALSFIVYTLILAEVLAVTASQFLSAILVSDFKEGAFANVANSTDVPILKLRRHDMKQLTTNPWLSSYRAAQTFAERAEPPTIGPGFHDSGHSYRAFLPFEDEARRTKLRSFDGPALLLDHRVVCVRPSLTRLLLKFSSDELRLSGRMEMSPESFPMLRLKAIPGEASWSNSFICRLPRPRSNAAEFIQGETGLCTPHAMEGSGAFLEDSLRDDSSVMFLLLDVLSPKSMPVVFDQDWTSDSYQNRSLQSTHANGSWALASSHGFRRDALRVTACYTNLEPKYFVVGMDRSVDGVEPRLPWDRKAMGFQTEAVRHLFGASTKTGSPGTRGLMTLTPRSQWKAFPLSDTEHVNFTLPVFSDLVRLPKLFNMRVILAAKTAGDIPDVGVTLSAKSREEDKAAYQTYSSLFQDTLRDTGNPALALQAIIAAVCQTAYYEKLAIEDRRAPASTSFSSSTLIPLRWTGFIVATAIVATHLVIFLTVTVLFLRLTSSSLLNNCWQAVSQVVTEDTLPILSRADSMKDKDIEQWAKSKSLHRKRFGVMQHRCRRRAYKDAERIDADRNGEGSEQTESI
ncbi:hypothetical protein CDD83_6111 [Cordyceps sp. RAO-2017]|nr:hypothetical protein CDD83_6111 [Cordyceps sp. RAO-2017]